MSKLLASALLCFPPPKKAALFLGAKKSAKNSVCFFCTLKSAHFFFAEARPLFSAIFRHFFLPSKSSGPKVGDPSYESSGPKVGDQKKKERAAGLMYPYCLTSKQSADSFKRVELVCA